MADFFEVDFLSVESAKSGDAIGIRYELNDEQFIHIVDGGFQKTGESVVSHIRQYYGRPEFIDHVVVTHPDGDHAGGLQSVLNEFDVGALWMLRPWTYASEIIDRFDTYNSVEHLERKLRETYSNLAALEEIAEEKGIPILEPLQGEEIGEFTVLAPTLERYLDLVVQSDKTPQTSEEQSKEGFAGLATIFIEGVEMLVSFVRAAWGEEVFSDQETSNENEMSVVQFANLCDETIVLTGDAGRGAMAEAADYAPFAGLLLPGVQRFQVPHHGSRRNVSSEILDTWLGQRLATQPNGEEGTFHAFISAAKEDKNHPRKAVVRALYHRGARVTSTEGKSVRTGKNAPPREGWVPTTPLPYPDDQEEE